MQGLDEEIPYQVPINYIHLLDDTLIKCYINCDYIFNYLMFVHEFQASL